MDATSNEIASTYVDKPIETHSMQTRTGDVDLVISETVAAAAGVEAENNATQTSQEPQEDEATANSALQERETKQPPRPDLGVLRLIEKAEGSAGKLVNLLAKHFPFFSDETRFDGRRVRFLKRAQIFVADLWAAFNGTSYCAFDDIDHLTMFAGRLLSMSHFA